MSDREPPSIWWRLPYTATGWLIAANVAIFAWILYAHGLDATDDNVVLFAYGAKFNPAMAKGEWYRLVASNFLHSGFLHIAVNMYALANMGLVCELIFGTAWFLVIYVFSAGTGAYIGFVGHKMLSVGASGAICGLGGVLVALGFLGREVVRPELGDQLRRGAVPFVLGNAAVGAVIGNIDNHAHGGGFAGGFFVGGLIVALAGAPKLLERAGVVLALAALGVVGWSGYEAFVHLPGNLAAVEISELGRRAFDPMSRAQKAAVDELDRLYPKGEWKPPADRARGMAWRKAVLELLEARARFRATIQSWPEPADPAVRTALADTRKRDRDLAAMADRVARYADRTVDEDLRDDFARNRDDWDALLGPVYAKATRELRARFEEIYPIK